MVPLRQGSQTDTMANPMREDLTRVPAGHATALFAPFIAPASTKSAPTKPGAKPAHAALPFTAA
jgi:hypothetical protein